MTLSRLRLQLAGTYAVGIFVGMLALGSGMTWFIGRQADHRFSDALVTAAREMDTAIGRELKENPGMTESDATRDALGEWPDRQARFLVLGSGGTDWSTTAAVDSLETAWFAELAPGVIERQWLAGAPIRIAVRPATTVQRTIVSYAPTAPLRAEQRALLTVLALLIPTALLGSIVVGYLFSAFALAPIARLTEQVAGLDPRRLDLRIPIGPSPDEISRLTEQINEFLTRIEDARRRNQQFVAQAAHQLRTPLTLVLGEAALSLQQNRSEESYREALGRVARAAGHMARRVDELFLLARADAGDSPALTDRIELDALVLETAELVSSRARSLGRKVEFGRVDGVVVLGAEWLVREAILELLENACRHGTADRGVRLEVYQTNGQATIMVQNGGVRKSEGPASQPERGLGTAVLRWVAAVHGGRLIERDEPGLVVTGIELPALVELAAPNERTKS